MASDPFFGRGGRMLAVSQRELKLKFEILVPVISEEKPTAVCSFNCHQDHFGKIFDIKTTIRRDRPHRVPRLRHGAARHGSFQDARFRPARVAGRGARNSVSMSAVSVLHIDPGKYRPHSFHGEDSLWIEKNCYIDVWIEVLHAQSLDPAAMLAFVVALDFDGDQWTFFKPSHADLYDLYGVDVQELNVWRPLLQHAVRHVGDGRLVFTEADAFFSPIRRAPTTERSTPRPPSSSKPSTSNAASSAISTTRATTCSRESTSKASSA